MKDRTKILVTVFILAQQLKTWIAFSRDMGAMTRDFKYLSGILLNAVTNFLKYFFDGLAEEDETVYEHSVKVSDLVETLLAMDDKDLRRIEGLIIKIKNDATQ